MKPIRVLIGAAIWNEGEKFERAAAKMEKFLDEQQNRDEVFYKFLVVDDGSGDGVADKLQSRYPFYIWEYHEINHGAGAAMRTFYQLARDEGYDIAVAFAGNGKDDPEEIPKLINPIIHDGYDLVQGSRYLPGGEHHGLPFYRLLATKYVHPGLVSWFAGQKITDSTNGFRAIRLSMLDDERINLDQDWLDRYELEPYLLYQAIKLGYKVCEAPVKKTYPESGVSYTKMTPFIGWWSILRPLFLLKLGLKK